MQNLVGIDSAVTDLRMREKTRLRVDLISRSIYLSIIVSNDQRLPVTSSRRPTMEFS